MALIILGHLVFPVEGIDINDMDSYASIMFPLESHYFLFPFLGHATDTLIDAFAVAIIAISHKMKFALGIGSFFLLSSIYTNYLLRGPVWFTAADIVLEHVPMAWIGGKLAFKFSKKQ
jgi:hypothetical protein